MIVSRFDTADNVSTNTSALTIAEDDVTNFDVRLSNPEKELSLQTSQTHNADLDRSASHPVALLSD